MAGKTPLLLPRLSLIAAVLAATMVIPATATPPFWPPFPGSPPFPWTPPFPWPAPPPGVGNCLRALTEVDGCQEAVLAALSTGSFNIPNTRPCCDAVLSVADSCWPNQSPYLPQLKGYCTLYLHGPPAAPQNPPPPAA